MLRFFLMFKTIFSLIIFFPFSLFSSPSIGLALSGGGARGLSHIGMLKVIDEMNIQVDFIAGTSVGAVVGGMYAMGYSAKEIEDIVINLDWEEAISSKIKRECLSISEKRWLPYASYYFDLDDYFVPTLPKAFLSGNSLTNTFFEITYPAAFIDDFSELPIPFSCITTNLETGEEKVVTNWKMHEAMRASMSFPSLFQPFVYDGQQYIDGGIQSNLPVDIVQEMGANFIIGMQASTGLRAGPELETLIDVLDQTINISIAEKVEISAKKCDILLEPELDGIDLMDFHRKKEIIRIGEQCAREFLKDYPDLPKRISKLKKMEAEDKFYISSISVEGNHYLSSSKIKEYINLNKGDWCTLQDVIEAIENAYHSTLFNEIYPTLVKKNDGVHLIIKVNESHRKKLGFDIVYHNNKEMNALFTVELNNVIQHNSKFIGNLKLGAENELNLDYVKNFGKHFGVYFRLFPYVREFTLYSYNLDHEKTNSVKNFRYGSTLGIGAFAEQALAVEVYSFAFKSKLYQNIGEFNDTNFSCSGFGIKMYHESLDDVTFPMRGAQCLAKISINQESKSSWDKKFYSKLKLLFPFNDKFSAEYSFEYGSFFRNSEIAFYDPFYIGGLNNFLGLQIREKSAPIYKINSISISTELYQNLFAKITFNSLNLGNTDTWEFSNENLLHGIGGEIGYRSLLGPLRFATAWNSDSKVYFYFSLGFDHDAFEFSRN